MGATLCACFVAGGIDAIHKTDAIMMTEQYVKFYYSKQSAKKLKLDYWFFKWR